MELHTHHDRSAAIDPKSGNLPTAFGGGAVISERLGGLIGLGGAEFRLPLLIGVFRFGALEAVILNKAMSLIVVATALPFRAGAVPFAGIAINWPILLNLSGRQSAGRMGRRRLGDAPEIRDALQGAGRP